VEDFARGIITLENEQGEQVLIEATTSWAYVGAGLRIQLELLGPEYSMEFSSLSTGLKVFLSRNISGEEGEDMIEKQNAESGSCPCSRTRPAATATRTRTGTWWRHSGAGLCPPRLSRTGSA
jgi:hypothetical protein